MQINHKILVNIFKMVLGIHHFLPNSRMFPLIKQLRRLHFNIQSILQFINQSNSNSKSQLEARLTFGLLIALDVYVWRNTYFLSRLHYYQLILHEICTKNCSNCFSHFPGIQSDYDGIKQGHSANKRVCNIFMSKPDMTFDNYFVLADVLLRNAEQQCTVDLEGGKI